MRLSGSVKLRCAFGCGSPFDVCAGRCFGKSFEGGARSCATRTRRSHSRRGAAPSSSAANTAPFPASPSPRLRVRSRPNQARRRAPARRARGDPPAAIRAAMAAAGTTAAASKVDTSSRRRPCRLFNVVSIVAACADAAGGDVPGLETRAPDKHSLLDVKKSPKPSLSLS